MYVTDVPRIERWTNPILAELDRALNDLQEHAAALDIAVKYVDGTYSGSQITPATLPDRLESVSEARDAVLTASERMGGALALLGIEAL